MMNVIFLDWDTKYFGFKVGIIEIDKEKVFSLEQLKNDARIEGYKLVYLKSSSLLDDYTLFFDEKLVYSKIKEDVEDFMCPEIETYRQESIEAEIYELALKSGECSRYKLDQNFPTECFQLLYNKWIENSIYTDYATDVLVYRLDRKPVGLLTFRNSEDTSSIGIIAVGQDFQGYGIGSKLIKYYQSILSNNIKMLTVVTQGVNKPARFFYEKNGYEVTSRTYIYHLWL
jgi:ribosomal protein S18 acetylase RimI-like enzyme